MESDGWEQKIPGDKYIADMKRIYYPEFVDFCFADTDADKGCVELSRKVGEKMAFATKSGDVELAIDDLSLYLMPMDVTLLKIGVSFDVDDLNKATAVLASLRMVDYYSAEDWLSTRCWCSIVLSPAVMLVECRGWWSRAISLEFSRLSIAIRVMTMPIWQVCLAM